MKSPAELDPISPAIFSGGWQIALFWVNYARIGGGKNSQAKGGGGTLVVGGWCF